jgi:hypothetical protein
VTVDGEGSVRIPLGQQIASEGEELRNVFLLRRNHVGTVLISEAGLVGTVVSEEPFGCYRYAKQRKSRKAMVCEVTVFLFAVERQLRKWPEKSQRETRMA